MKYGLSEKTVAHISGALAQFPEIETAVLFGSRAKGNFKPGSDIDLALLGRALDLRTLGKIEDALDDLLLPYKFSLLSLHDGTDPDVAAHIRRVGVVFFERSGFPAQQGKTGSVGRCISPTT